MLWSLTLMGTLIDPRCRLSPGLQALLLLPACLLAMSGLTALGVTGQGVPDLGDSSPTGLGELLLYPDDPLDTTETPPGTDLFPPTTDATGLEPEPPAHVIGTILSAGSSLTPDTQQSIIQLVGNGSLGLSGIPLEDHGSHDVSAFHKAVQTLRTVRPEAVVGHYQWAYAVATEHLRIPYFVTSLTPRDQPETPFLIQLFPPGEVFAHAAEDVLQYYKLTKVAVFHDSEIGKVVLERLAQRTWMEVTGFAVSEMTINGVRDELKLIRSHYYNTVVAVLSPENTRYLLDQGLSLSMFSPPYKWLLLNMGLTEYKLQDYVDSRANITALRLMMAYMSDGCLLGQSDIDLESAAFHDAVQLFTHLMASRDSQQKKLSMRRAVRNLQMDGCTGKLVFSKVGKRTENFLQLITLQGYLTGATGTWRSEPAELNQRVEPFRRYSAISQQFAGNAFPEEPLRVTTLMEEPFVQRKTDTSIDSGHPVYEGFCIDILMEMSRLLGFKFNITEVPDKKFGSLKPPPRGWTGMIRQLVDDKADLALAPFQMSTERAEVVDFTKPFMTKGTTVVVKRPGHKIGMFQFLSPFSHVVWFAIFVAFVGTSLMLFAVSRVNSDCQAKYAHNLRESFWYIWGTLLRGSLTGSPFAISSRIVSSAWWFFALIISSIYTANLAAFLTITISDVGVNTAADLAMQEEFDYGTVEGSQTEKFFKHTRMTYYARMWAHMSVLSPTSMSRRVEIGFDRVRKGKYAFIWDSPTIRHTISNDCDLMEIGSPFDLKGYGFAYTKNAAYGELLSLALLKMQDSGTLYKFERKWWRPQICPNHQQSAKTKSLDLETVAGMYVVILSGALISTLICLLQYLYGRYAKKRKLRKQERGQGQGSNDQLAPEDESHRTQAPRHKTEVEPDKEITYANHSLSPEDWKLKYDSY